VQAHIHVLFNVDAHAQGMEHGFQTNVDLLRIHRQVMGDDDHGNATAAIVCIYACGSSETEAHVKAPSGRIP
jgi:hypothetical protein